MIVVDVFVYSLIFLAWCVILSGIAIISLAVTLVGLGIRNVFRRSKTKNRKGVASVKD